MVSDQIIEVIEEAGLDSGDVLLYENSPFSEEYGRISELFNTVLTNTSAYGHNPSIYYTHIEVQKFRAFATRLNGLGIIRMSPPFLNYLHETAYSEESQLIEYLEDFVHEQTIFHGGIRQFVYDFCLWFIFYHELGHLLQNVNNECEVVDYYESEDENEFNIQIHALETDADEFAALCSFQHIYDYTRRLSQDGQNITEQALFDYTVSCLSTVILVMIKLHPNFDEFYLRERKHPHPSIRIVYFSITLVQYLNQSAVRQFELEDLNPTEVIFSALNLVHEHLRVSENDDRVEVAQQMIRENLEDIMEYYEELRVQMQSITDLAVIAWNRVANGE